MAIEQNLRYTEALRRSETGEREREQYDGGETAGEIGLTALDALHVTAERVKATDAADTATALMTIFEALSLTAAANNLIDQALLELGQVYWPGENFLADARQQYLDRAVEGLGSALGSPIQPPTHDWVKVLAPPDMEPTEYWPYQPDGYDGVVCAPDSTEKARQLLLFRTQAVALANKTVWVQVGVLLGRVLGRVRDPQDRKASRIAALVVEEILNRDSGRPRRDVDQRILAITIGRRSTDELVADDVLMQLLRASAAATAHPNGWSMMSAVSAELEHADRDWTPARWGYGSDLKLIAATKQFSIRRLLRKGQEVIEIRARRRTEQTGTRQ
ncbi:hypothetical protein [Nocardia sp. NPDC003979]